MTDLATQLERLGLEQYLDALIAEGFDTWEILLDIQESDLDVLNVKLGHRRKLQRAIADFRGISYERLLGSPAHEGLHDASKHADAAQATGTGKDGSTTAPTETKRKYRRHPKLDENAPEKPPSAYVLFSNKVREDVKPENLSFTDIAKLVGERWQKLEPAEKEPFETQAQSLKKSYEVQLSAYKKTESYRQYSQYLAEFRAKHGQVAESKRPKLDPQSSGGSISAASQELIEGTVPPSTHVRVGSIGSVSTASHTGALPSPVTLTNVASLPNPNSSPAVQMITGPRSGSPPTYHGRDRRRLGHLSTQSSMSDDSGQVRSESYDTLSRTATLSLSTPPASTPPLPTNLTGSSRPEHISSSETFHWPGTRQPLGLSQPSSASGSQAPNLTLPSPSVVTEAWRDRGPDAHRQYPAQSSVPLPPGGFQSTLPPLPFSSSERLPDLTRGQRTLPPPLRQPPPVLSNQSSFSPRLTGQVIGHTVQRPSSADERHDNEAATTLAGLAGRPSDDFQTQPHDHRR